MQMNNLDPRIKDAVRLHYKGRCQYCGVSGAKEIDHIVPLAKGGADDVTNITLACRRCNTWKQATELDPMYVAIAHARARDAAQAIMRLAARTNAENGVVTVPNLAALGGSVRLVSQRIANIGKSGLDLQIVSEGWDTTAPDGHIVFDACSILSDCFRAWTAEKRYRPRKPRKVAVCPETLRAAEAMLENKSVTMRQAADALGVSPAAIYRARAHKAVADRAKEMGVDRVDARDRPRFQPKKT